MKAKTGNRFKKQWVADQELMVDGKAVKAGTPIAHEDLVKIQVNPHTPAEVTLTSQYDKSDEPTPPDPKPNPDPKPGPDPEPTPDPKPVPGIDPSYPDKGSIILIDGTKKDKVPNTGAAQ